MKLRLLFKIFASFFKIGITAFGGGYAVVSLLQRETVEYRNWITEEELADIMAISQTLPGIITVNSSTIIGYRLAGFSGALVATLASILPTFVLILLVTLTLWDYTDNAIVKKAFSGILLGVTALIIHSTLKMWKHVVKNRIDIVLVFAASLLMLLFNRHVPLIILAIGVAGFFSNFLANMRGGKKN